MPDARPTLGRKQMVMTVIDVMAFDDDARIARQRAFQDIGMLRPA